MKYSAIQMDIELESRALKLVEAVLALKDEKDEAKVVEAIKTYNLVREHIPTDMLNSVPVWQALLAKMPMTAMIRNLGKMQSIGALTFEYRKIIVDKLTNESELKRARIHPIQVLLAKTVYQAGHGDKGHLKWEKDELIDKALEKAFYLSFINAPSTNKRFCFAFDVSGSMCARISGTMLSCRTASAALSLVSLKNEKDVECVAFCDHLVELPFNGDWTIEKIENYVDNLDFGATDCALPMLWAKEKNKKFDVFVVYTDCETFFGEVHPFAALKQYREASGITDAKLVVMGMTSTGFTIADPEDAGMIDIVGFDSAVPTLLADFVNGKV
ncbi:SS-A/Ro ribonucleoprotein like protein [Oesophagostomum dentatum]|uniref:SS-A/Ro ribonucleoprotein like protein n=1 Tax=Oesophagostomum dentatum TaxID=61180 RepID=A0A0B1TN20_OESDE|nr:SS-A/Ro ribonucleoprotein like protein [Oesophagostomum dentatum]